MVTFTVHTSSTSLIFHSPFLGWYTVRAIYFGITGLDSISFNSCWFPRAVWSC
jgi:hypothetical protein